MMASREALQVVLTIARFLGIFPFDHPSHLGFFYQVFMLWLTLSITIISTYGNSGMIYRNISTMNIIIDLLTAVFTTLQGIAIHLTFLLHTTTWRKLIQELKLEKARHLNISVYLKLFFIHFFFGVKIGWTFFVILVIQRWDFNPYLACRILYEYYGVILVTLLVYINGIIKTEFHSIHVILLKNSAVFCNNFNSTDVRKLQSAYRKLSLLVDYLNKVFGYPILSIMACAITMMLNSLCNALIFYDINILLLSCNMVQSIFASVLLTTSILLFVLKL